MSPAIRSGQPRFQSAPATRPAAPKGHGTQVATTRCESSSVCAGIIQRQELKSPRINSNSLSAAQVFDDLGGDDVGVFEVGRVFQAVVLEPEDVQAHLVALHEIFIAIRPPVALGVRVRPSGSSRRVASDQLPVARVRCMLVRRSWIDSPGPRSTVHGSRGLTIDEHQVEPVAGIAAQAVSVLSGGSASVPVRPTPCRIKFMAASRVTPSTISTPGTLRKPLPSKEGRPAVPACRDSGFPFLL